LVTVAVTVTVSVPSTVEAAAATATLGGFELLPQPARYKTENIATARRREERPIFFEITKTSTKLTPPV
jgi:hypothetical protein